MLCWFRHFQVRASARFFVLCEPTIAVLLRLRVVVANVERWAKRTARTVVSSPVSNCIPPIRNSLLKVSANGRGWNLASCFPQACLDCPHRSGGGNLSVRERNDGQPRDQIFRIDINAAEVFDCREQGQRFLSRMRSTSTPCLRGGSPPKAWG